MIRMEATILSWKIGRKKKKVDLDAIMQEENQKKTSGLNLHSAKDILRKYSDANLITSSGDYLFKQELIFK